MTNEQLVLRIKSGENVAENMLELWRQLKRLIHVIAKDYMGYAEIEDLNQEGYIGLCNAVQHYDADKGVLFSNYAVFWIRQTMRRYVCMYSSSLRFPEYVQNEVQQYKKVKSDYLKIYGTEPTDGEICGLLGVSFKKYKTIKENTYMSYVHSMSEPIAGESEEITLGDSIASDQSIEDNVIKQVDTAAKSVFLWESVDDLTTDMTNVVNMRYKEGLTRKEVGDCIGISCGQVRRAEEKALKILRGNRLLHGYYNQYIATRHVGVSEFNRTWMSEVEIAALGIVR